MMTELKLLKLVLELFYNSILRYLPIFIHQSLKIK
jgi:hypothetical protein